MITGTLGRWTAHGGRIGPNVVVGALRSNGAGLDGWIAQVTTTLVVVVGLVYTRQAAGSVRSGVWGQVDQHTGPSQVSS